MKKWIKKIFALIVINTFLFTIGCSVNTPTTNNNRDAIDNALNDSIHTNRKLQTSQKQVPKAQNVLMPELNVNIPKSKTRTESEPKFDVVVNNIPAKEFFMGLVKDTKYNMTVNPKIAGNISLELTSVTIPQVMDAVRDAYGFEYKKTSYGYKVFPRHLETRIFNVNYIDIDRVGQSQTTIGSGQITNTVQNTLTSSGVSTSQQTGSIPSGTVTTSSSSQFWVLLKQNLETIIGTEEGRSIVVNPRSGTLIVRAYPNELRSVAKYLDSIQDVLHRQVIIEAKVLEVELNANFQSGINWKILGLEQSPNVTANANGNLPPSYRSSEIQDFIGILKLNAKDGGAFGSVINLLNNQGNVNVLSSPRISTINNQKAVIKVGDDQFFVTNVSTNTSSSSSSSDNTSTSDITLTPFFSGISLDVTPQIDENDEVTIHIHPIVSKVIEEKKIFRVDDREQELPLAKSIVRESDSIVRAKNGQVIVIGGLMKSEGSDYNASTPGADKLPGINGLFKNTNKASRKYELVILLRPIVAQGTITWQHELKRAAENIKNMQGDFRYSVVPNKQKR